MGKQILYFYEELGWAVIFTLNTLASIILYLILDDLGEYEILLQLNLVFGAVYLPWQLCHLRALRISAKYQNIEKDFHLDISWDMLIKGFNKSIHMKNPTTQPEAWGGFMGMTWMVSYWIFLIPIWLYLIVQTI